MTATHFNAFGVELYEKRDKYSIHYSQFQVWLLLIEFGWFLKPNQDFSSLPKEIEDDKKIKDIGEISPHFGLNSFHAQKSLFKNRGWWIIKKYDKITINFKTIISYLQ